MVEVKVYGSGKKIKQSERQKSLHRKSKKEHRKSKIQNIESLKFRTSKVKLNF
jgi:uncharacterized Zn ribbon protein